MEKYVRKHLAELNPVNYDTTTERQTMIDNIEIITEGFDLKDKTVRLLKPNGSRHHEGRECTVVAKYALDDYYYVRIKSGTTIVAKRDEFIIL